MLTEPACTHCMVEGGGWKGVGGGREVSESLIVVLDSPLSRTCTSCFTDK